MPQVLVTRQGLLVSRTTAINELKSRIVVAPEHLRAALRGCTPAGQLDRIEDQVTVLTLPSISARVPIFTAQLDELDLVCPPPSPSADWRGWVS